MLARPFVILFVLLSCQTAPPYRYDGVKLKGVNLVAPPRQPDSLALAPVRAMNGEWVAVVPYGFCRKGDPHFFFSENQPKERKKQGQWWGETPSGVAETVRMARRQGLKTMLKPHVWMQGGSHLDLEFTTEADWQTFEHDYAQYVLFFAKMADSLNVDLYCITTELDRFVLARPAFWQKLINQVKQIYRGKLTYAANWDRYERIPFWNQLDYVGVDAYFPISDTREPSVRDLTRGWKSHLTALRNVSDRLQKPILFTEFGYRSCDYTARRPWESETDCAPNPTAQANAYRALLEAVWPQPWFAGGFAWKWFMETDPRHRERDQYSPQGRLAEGVLREGWLASTNYRDVMNSVYFMYTFLIMLHKAIPLLRIFDLAKAEEFYVHWLGFRSDWQHRFEDNAPVYWQISKDNLTLHLTEHHGDCTPGAKVFVECNNLRAYHEELIVKNYRFKSPRSGESVLGCADYGKSLTRSVTSCCSTNRLLIR